MSRTRAAILALLALVTVAHGFLWASDMPAAVKWRLTALNAAGWAVVLGPVWLVGRWLAATERRNREGRDGPR
ncbi:MAG: phenylalanyl-tRNA synthetase subunit beta [Hasllibacter sp.]